MIVLFDLGLILILIILQTTLAEFVADLTGAKPDLILLVVVSFGLLRGRMTGIGYGWALGLLQDGLSGSLLGQNALSKGLIGYVAGVLHRHLGEFRTITQMLVASLATLFDAAIHLGTAFLLYGALAGKEVLGRLGIVLLLNAAVVPFVTWMVRACLHRAHGAADEALLGRPR